MGADIAAILNLSYYVSNIDVMTSGRLFSLLDLLTY